MQLGRLETWMMMSIYGQLAQMNGGLRMFQWIVQSSGSVGLCPAYIH
jgi:hypothetical protein